MAIKKWSLCLTLLLSACAAADHQHDDAAVAVSDARADAPGVACSVGKLPSAVGVVEGGRVQVKLAPTAAVTQWKIGPADPFAVVKQTDDSAWLKAPYGQQGTFHMAVTISCGATQQTQSFTIAVHSLKWSRLAQWTEGKDGPLAREYASMWLDEADPNRLLLFGGFHYQPHQFTPAWDMWELNVSSGVWTSITPKSEPPHAPGGRVALVPGTQELLYLGGITDLRKGATDYQLSRFNYASDQLNWRNEPIASGIGQGDYQPGFFYDEKRQRFLSVCGANQQRGWHCDVHAYTPAQTNSAVPGGKWEVVDVQGTAPPGRNGHYFAYDAETDRLILFGGDTQGKTWGDTWALNLGQTPPKWTLLNNDPTLARRNGAFALDPINHRFLIWGGTATGATAVPDIWALDLDATASKWVQVKIANSPPNRSSANAVYDPKQRRIIAGFGNSELGTFPDLWALQL